MSSDSEIHSLRFLYRYRELDDEQQEEREWEKGDTDLDIERNDADKKDE